jgi:hypothetical protein
MSSRQDGRQLDRPRDVDGVATGVLVASLLRRVRVWLCRMVGFVAEPVDELVTAWLGIAPVLPRLRRWWRQVRIQWRMHRSDVVEGEVMDGVWR